MELKSQSTFTWLLSFQVFHISCPQEYVLLKLSVLPVNWIHHPYHTDTSYQGDTWTDGSSEITPGLAHSPPSPNTPTLPNFLNRLRYPNRNTWSVPRHCYIGSLQYRAPIVWVRVLRPRPGHVVYKFNPPRFCFNLLYKNKFPRGHNIQKRHLSKDCLSVHGFTLRQTLLGPVSISYRTSTLQQPSWSFKPWLHRVRTKVSISSL